MAVVAHGTKFPSETPVKIVGKVLNFENHRVADSKTGEKLVCDVRTSLPETTKTYEGVQMRQVKSEHADEYGIFVMGVGKDDPNNPDRL